MTHLSSLLRASTIALVAMVTVPHGARAQAYPSQDVNFICGFAAGSGADIIVRYFADKMRPLMNRNDRRPEQAGRARNIATEYVARSKPDGYTILVTGGNSVAASMHLFKKAVCGRRQGLPDRRHHQQRDHDDRGARRQPIKTIPDLTAAMKEKGDKASYAFANPTAKVLGAMYKEKAGLKSIEVAYRTGADFLTSFIPARSTMPSPTTSRRWRRRTPAACEFWPSAPASGCRRRRIFRP